MMAKPTFMEEEGISLPRRSEIVKQVKQEGMLLAGVLPIHYPRELLRAFQIHPMEIWGPPKVDPTKGISHLQPYICSIVRNALAFQQSGGMDLVDLILVPHACDSLQGLGSVLLDFIQPKQPVIPFYLPRGVGKVGEEYLVAELRKLYIHLKIITGKTPSDDDLLEAVFLEEKLDHAFSEMYLNRDRSTLSNVDFYRLLRSREFLPADRFLEVSIQGSGNTREESNAEIPLILSGIVPEPMEVLGAIEEYGGRVVGDDFACCGRRRYPQGESGDPFQRMAERLLQGPPDWNKGNPIQERIHYLEGLAEETGAKGILFYSVKFCEPELFDLPMLRSDLQSQGIPSLVVEVDINDSMSNQVLTRMEAFLEMIA
jgi:benzoyl-CoA reductase/2-hydroxyglutaryl-CoA dehydratase subunit BcrC/BadD/HgdB